MTVSGSTYHLRAGEAAKPPYDVVVTPKSAGWGYSGLAVLSLAAGASAAVETGETEVLVLSLGGGCTVTGEGNTLTVTGRESVFAGPSDFVYVPRGASVQISSTDGGRFALPSSLCTSRLPMRHQPASAVPVELRGAGQASRQVNNFCTPDAFEADRLIACEVLTPGGNWSSYPPHKHDEESDCEAILEEIYLFRVDGRHGFGAHRTYDLEQGWDVTVTVRSDDVFLVPRGYHGPSMAAPGYHLYYLNVMAGAGERAWRFNDDPEHAWVRGTWDGQEIDPRLPLSSAAAGTR